MKAFIIRIKNNARSEEAALETYESARRYKFDVEYFDAYTPKDNPIKLFEANNIQIDNSKLSQPELACWYSHYSLWKEAYRHKEPILILEHDAIVKAECPNILRQKHNGVVNVTKPYFGELKKIQNTKKYAKNDLKNKGFYFGQLRSKQPGACGYIINEQIISLINQIRIISKPVDTTLFYTKNNSLQHLINRFEYYPWIIECSNRFTTIQKWKKDSSNSEDPKLIIAQYSIDENPFIDPDTGNTIKAKSYKDPLNNIIYTTDE